MKAKILPVLAMAFAFAAGALVFAWYERIHALPPPSVRPLEEFSRDSRKEARQKAKEAAFQAALTPQKVAELNRRLASLKPQMEAFRTRFNAIESDFHARLEGVLTDRLKKRLPAFDPLDEDFELYAGRRLREKNERSQTGALAIRFVLIVAYRPYLGHLARTLQLTEPQKVQVRTLLEERRVRFLSLVDEMPPPSLGIGPLLRQEGLAQAPEGPAEAGGGK